MESIKGRLDAINQKIEESAAKGGNLPEQIRLVAVTKTVDSDMIRQVASFGIQDIGENRVQDFLSKYDLVTEKLNWHFIGHLQSNKVKYLVDRVSLIHSLDRGSLAKEINRRGKLSNHKFNCLVQVNVSGENTKYGIDPKDVEKFLVKVSKMEYINVLGLMTMAPYENDPEDARYVFAGLRVLRDKLLKLEIPNIKLKYLSMGMSNDYQIALEEGANIVRIGSEIFKDLKGGAL